MGLLNTQGDWLARTVQRRLVQAGLNDISTISIHPETGRRLVLRHGPTLHRVEIQPFETANVSLPREPGWRPLVVAKAFDDKTAWDLADDGTSFLDERGNAHLVLDGQTVLFVSAADNAPTRTSRTKRSDLHPSGIHPSVLTLNRASHRVVFALLCNPDLAGASARSLAKTSGVSLGTTHNTREQLKVTGHLYGGRLHKPGELLDFWTDAYRRVRFPQLTPRPLYAENLEWIHQLLTDPSEDMLVGGAVAAGILTDRLRATDGVAWISDVGAAVRRLRLKPNPTSFRVDLRERFWGEGLPSPKPGMVPSVLVYGDLVGDDDERSAKVAQYLREHDAHLRTLDR